MALGCYLAIPAVVIAGAGLFRVIDPEMVHATTDYVRNYRLLEQAANGVPMATAGHSDSCSSPCSQTARLRRTTCTSISPAG